MFKYDAKNYNQFRQFSHQLDHPNMNPDSSENKMNYNDYNSMVYKYLKNKNGDLVGFGNGPNEEFYQSDEKPYYTNNQQPIPWQMFKRRSITSSPVKSSYANQMNSVRFDPNKRMQQNNLQERKNYFFHDSLPSKSTKHRKG